MADDEEIHVNTDQARGASTPGVTRYVLAISMILLIAIFAVLVFR